MAVMCSSKRRSTGPPWLSGVAEFRTSFLVVGTATLPALLPVCLVRGDGVQVAGGEERMESVRVEQRWLSFGGFLIQFRDPAHDQAPHDAFGFLA